ncbi:MAG: HEPN domain-containing protein [Candidatus Thermoplasmatota archaeon]
MIEKELKEAEYDLGRAKHAFEEEDYKWCIVKSYYSMFHASKAIVFSVGYKERRHFAIQVVLENLVKGGKLENIYTQYFSSAMSAREGVDYRYVYSGETAKEMLEIAKKFLARMKKLLVIRPL